MKTFWIVVFLVFACANSSIAQTVGSTSQRSALRHGKAAVWAGVLMVGAGAFLLPVTAAGEERGNGAMVASAALMGAGAAVIYWGVKQQQKATRPSTSFGVAVGRRSALVVRRSW